MSASFREEGRSTPFFKHKPLTHTSETENKNVHLLKRFLFFWFHFQLRILLEIEVTIIIDFRFVHAPIVTCNRVMFKGILFFLFCQSDHIHPGRDIYIFLRHIEWRQQCIQSIYTVEYILMRLGFHHDC